MQHAEKKGETIKNLWVIRRVGGLEVGQTERPSADRVIRRVGGLEVVVVDKAPFSEVIRRVGGLEVHIIE